MAYILALMSTALVASLVMNTLAHQPYGASKHFDHLDSDYGIPPGQGLNNGQSTKIHQGSRSMLKAATSPRPQISGCGKTKFIKGRIVGGQKVDMKGKFPWMVALLWDKFKNGSYWEQFCGGALISNRHILTASHCVADESPSGLMVRLGESNMNIKYASPSRRDVAVSAIFEHEDYDDKTAMNDIAIIQLEEEIENWTDFIRPICLATEPWNLEGKKATVAGWGDLLEDSEIGSEFLMEVDLPIIGMKQCKESYSKGELIRPIVKEQICAGYPNGGKDSCQGDSGGPLMFQMDHTKPWTAIGVISWGYGCARKGKPGVYARVESYYDWIQSKMAIE